MLLMCANFFPTNAVKEIDKEKGTYSDNDVEIYERIEDFMDPIFLLKQTWLLMAPKKSNLTQLFKKVKHGQAILLRRPKEEGQVVNSKRHFLKRILVKHSQNLIILLRVQEVI